MGDQGKRLCHFGGSFLEIGRIAVIHRRVTLARSGIQATSRAEAEIDGLRHGRIVHTEDRRGFPTVAEEGRNLHFHRLYHTIGNVCYGERYFGRQESEF